jgi:peptide-methionine (R)-S-oxide reductase
MTKPTVKKTDEEYKAQLSPQEFEVTRKKGTERAFTGKYWNCHDSGMYQCICCGADLFRSDDKFDSGCGWPSFTQPVETSNVEESEDRSHFMVRTEVTCSECGAHLGHVFPDGPPDRGGLRYCINSASLDLKRDPPTS